MKISVKSQGIIYSCPLIFETVFSDFAVTGFPFGWMMIGDSAFPNEGAFTIDFFGFLISSFSSNSSMMISESNSKGSVDKLFAS